MRAALLFSTWTVVAVFYSPLPAQDANAGRGEGAVSQSARDPVTNWRYRYYNGQWWYYHPTSRWLYWTGKAWTGYGGSTSSQRLGNQLNVDDHADSFGQRPALSIQHEKNEARGLYSDSMGLRPPRTIQSQKNDSRSRSSETLSIRPPLTIQHEKNDARAR